MRRYYRDWIVHNEKYWAMIINRYIISFFLSHSLTTHSADSLSISLASDALHFHLYRIRFSLYRRSLHFSTVMEGSSSSNQGGIPIRRSADESRRCSYCLTLVLAGSVSQHQQNCPANPNPAAPLTADNLEFIKKLGMQMIQATEDPTEADLILQLLKDIENPPDNVRFPYDALCLFGERYIAQRTTSGDNAETTNKEGDVKDKSLITVVVIGLPDSGKSTVTGHLVAKLGDVDSDILDIFKKEACLKNNMFISLINHLKGEGFFESNNFSFRFIDAPGQWNKVEDMISGTCQADIALLMVDSTSRYFENNRLHEHAFLAFTLCVKELICCINKMDSSDDMNSKDLYINAQQAVASYLADVGYNTTRVPFIPVSSIDGDNLLERSTKYDWYKGPTLLEAFDQRKEPVKELKALRMPVQKVSQDRSLTSLDGRIEAGKLSSGMHITLGPAGLLTKAKSLLQQGVSNMLEARAGHMVRLQIPRVDNQTVVKAGNVVSNSKNDPAKKTVCFTAKVLVVNCSGEVRTGYAPVLYCHTAQVAVSFSKLLSKVDRKTGKILEYNPLSLNNGDTAMVEISPMESVVVEEVSRFPYLGRFYLKDMDMVTVIGVVSSVEKEPVITRGARTPKKKKK